MDKNKEKKRYQSLDFSWISMGGSNFDEATTDLLKSSFDEMIEDGTALKFMDLWTSKYPKEKEVFSLILEMQKVSALNRIADSLEKLEENSSGIDR